MMRLTLPELGNPTDPGRYDSRYGVIEVTADDLWILDPTSQRRFCSDATFALFGKKGFLARHVRIARRLDCSERFDTQPYLRNGSHGS